MAVKFDYQQTQRDANELIEYFGMDAVLRRAGTSPTDRPCRVVIFDEPRERGSDLATPVDRKVYLSPLTEDGVLDPEPDNEQDVLVTFVQPPTDPPVEDGKPKGLTCKPKKTAPAGIVALWEFTVRR